MALCRPVMASMSVALPLSSSYRVRPPPREAIHTLLSGASANAVTSLSPSQPGRWPPSSQLRGFQRLTPPARVPIHTRPVASWYSDMTNESRSESASLDRKSTRLNSSHEWISYAVFCLKKKQGNQFED